MAIGKTPLSGSIAVIAFLFFSVAMADLRDPFEKVMISLVVDGEQTLFILLAADGTVNRSGSGKLKNEDTEMFIGTSDNPLFETFMEEVPEYIFDHQGVYDFPDKEGEKCILTIIFESSDGSKTVGFRFDYGYRSGGPPADILNLLTLSVRVTDPWYESQKKLK